MKTIPLIQANLKGFMRNYKYVILLMVFPLILISLIFLAFNPDGLTQIPIGYIENGDILDMEGLGEEYFSYLSLTKYDGVEICKNSLKNYNEYVCLIIENIGETIKIEVIYDNTREPIIWEVIERIKSTIDLLQKAKSKEIASSFLVEFSQSLGQIREFKSNLNDAKRNIDSYIGDAINAARDLEEAKNYLSSSLSGMDDDIKTIKSEKQSLVTDKRNTVSQMQYSFRQVEGYANSIETIYNSSYYPTQIRQYNDMASNQMEHYSDRFDSSINKIEYRITEYERTSKDGWEYVDEIEEQTENVNSMKQDLIGYKGDIGSSIDELNIILGKFDSLTGVSAELLVNPVVLYNIPTYIPEVKSTNVPEEIDAGDVIKGLNLISLQTLYPAILLLIVLFLALLISSFMCLQHINSPAFTRTRLLKGIFLPEILSIFSSSIVIMLVPIICILFVGDLLFQLPIAQHVIIVLILLTLLTSTFTLMGMALAYLVKKESITLLICTFFLVYLIFLSGFYLPIERMTKFTAFIALRLPGRYVLTAFNKVVFYNQPLPFFSTEIMGLLTWFITMATIVILIKFLRRD